MKTIYKVLVAGMLAVAFNACKKDDVAAGNAKPTSVLPDEIRSDRTLTSDTVYTFVSGVLVTNNAVLTIEPGTVIKSNNGEGTIRARGIIIDRGAKILAVGTQDNPIVFTSGVKAGNRHMVIGKDYIYLAKPLSVHMTIIRVVPPKRLVSKDWVLASLPAEGMIRQITPGS